MDFKNIGNIFNKNQEEDYEEYEDDEYEEEDEESVEPIMGISAAEIAQYEQLSQYHEVPSTSSDDILAQATAQAKPKDIFSAPGNIADLKTGPAVIEDIVLKYLFSTGECSGIELANKLKINHNTIVAPIMANLIDAKFVEPTKSVGLGGLNKVYVLTSKGRQRAYDTLKESSYIGPAPVHIDDYVETANAYNKLPIPGFEELREYYADFVIDEKVLADMAIALSASHSLFLHGLPGMGKTSFISRFTKCCTDTIKVPYAVYVNGAVIQFYDKALHEPVDKNFNMDDPPPHDGADHRWVEIKRPCILVGTEFNARQGINIQYDTLGGSASFPVTTKANGGLFIIDDFGRQIETPDQILNLWINKLEGGQDVMNLKTGQQFYCPFNAISIFTTNLDPKELTDDAFLRRLSYKIQMPAVQLEQFCQIFAIEAERQGIQWDDDILEHLIREYYQKENKSFAGDQPRGLIARALQICKYTGESAPYKLTKEILDRSWKLHFLPED